MKRFPRTSLQHARCLLLVPACSSRRKPLRAALPLGRFHPSSAIPDAPLKRYAQGNLGIVLPSFARSYLVVAIAIYQAGPWVPTRLEAALDGWFRKLKGAWQEPKLSIEEWAKARAMIPGPNRRTAELGFRLAKNSRNTLQCYALPTRFLSPTAVLTLKDRAQSRFGVKSAELREWIHGQDVGLFELQSGKERSNHGLNAHSLLLQADRRYQIAAAHFLCRRLRHCCSDFDQSVKTRARPGARIARFFAADQGSRAVKARP